MNKRSLIELTVRFGDYGQHSKTVAVPIDEDLSRELLGSVELSDEPFSLMLASPSTFGGRGNAVTIRRQTFKMRREVALKIARDMVPALMEAFGVNDELDGYRVRDLSAEEKAYLRSRGRL